MCPKVAAGSAKLHEVAPHEWTWWRMKSPSIWSTISCLNWYRQSNLIDFHSIISHFSSLILLLPITIQSFESNINSDWLIHWLIDRLMIHWVFTLFSKHVNWVKCDWQNQYERWSTTTNSIKIDQFWFWMEIKTINFRLDRIWLHFHHDDSCRAVWSKLVQRIATWW
jgi:hypothetical protein